MTERMQFLWCERWPLIFWLATAMIFQVKSLLFWCIVFSFFVLMTKKDKGVCYLLAFIFGFPVAFFLG